MLRTLIATLLLCCFSVKAQVASIIPSSNRVDYVRNVTVGVLAGIPTGRATNVTLGAV